MPNGRYKLLSACLSPILGLAVLSCGAQNGEKMTRTEEAVSGQKFILDRSELSDAIARAESGNAAEAGRVYMHFDALGPQYADESLHWKVVAADLGDPIANNDLFATFLSQGKCDEARARLELMKSETMIDEKEYAIQLRNLEVCRPKI